MPQYHILYFPSENCLSILQWKLEKKRRKKEKKRKGEEHDRLDGC